MKDHQPVTIMTIITAKEILPPSYHPWSIPWRRKYYPLKQQTNVVNQQVDNWKGQGNAKLEIRYEYAWEKQKSNTDKKN